MYVTKLLQISDENTSREFVKMPVNAHQYNQASSREMSPMNVPRILLADDHPLVLEGVAGSPSPKACSTM
ncbi:MAG: hypothetical protein P8X46_13270 [Nitrospirales bacterium]